MKKKQLHKDTTKLKFGADNSELYNVEGICDSIVYAKALKDHYLPSFYNWILLKKNLKEKNT